MGQGYFGYTSIGEKAKITEDPDEIKFVSFG